MSADDDSAESACSGFDIIEGRRPSFLLDGSLLMTGGVDGTTGCEPSFLVQERLAPHGWAPDPPVLGDHALVARVRDWGLVVGTGCGHAVVINPCRHPMRLTGVDRLAWSAEWAT